MHLFFILLPALVNSFSAPNSVYLATNRFKVRSNNEVKFEQRWATRKSRIALLPGFKYFQLMKRVKGGDEKDPNYVSFTLWEDKPSFTEWRNGDAFKEAHGGKSGGFGALIKMISAMSVMKGPPKPAMSFGLFPLFGEKKLAENDPTIKVVNGWRVLDTDSTEPLPRESYVASNKFAVASDRMDEFEALWANRDSQLSAFDGFINFVLARRDGTAEDGYNFESITTWKNKKSFDVWRESENFKKSHSKKTGGTGMFTNKPKLVFYEGMLLLYSSNLT